MKKYQKLFNKKSLKEQISFLKLYKYGDENIMSLVDNLIKKFNAPRIDIYRALADLLTTLANEADQLEKEKSKSLTKGIK